MFRTSSASLLTSLLFALGCGGDSGVVGVKLQVVESEGWRVSAMTPRLTSGGLEVYGGVVFEQVGGAEQRSGGVCLVADLGGQRACATAADCASIPLPAGGFHYCTGVNGSPAKTCWTRPGPGGNYCTRGPRTAGTYLTPPVYVRVADAKTTWMSYVCLANTATPAGCAMNDPAQSISATSPTRVVPAP